MAIAFILLTMKPLSVLIFSSDFAAVWLASVPLTSGLIGYVFGNQDLVRWLAIAVSAFSALVHLHIRERPLSDAQPA